MAFEITATINVADTLARLNGQARQMPFAISKALNATAALVKDAERKEMQDVFDRPTPWTLNSVQAKSSTKQDLTAIVYLKDAGATSRGTPADTYLTPEIKGGGRGLKPFEYAFRAAGILPSSYYMVPGQGAKLDAYGNMARGQIVQLLSYFQTSGLSYRPGFASNSTAESRARLARGTKRRNNAGFVYFAVQPGTSHLAPGIYQRFMFGGSGNRGSAIKPVIMFVDSAHYEAIYDFAYVGQETVNRVFADELAKATADALATAR